LSLESNVTENLVWLDRVRVVNQLLNIIILKKFGIQQKTVGQKNILNEVDMFRLVIAISSLFFVGYKDREIGKKSSTETKFCVQPVDKNERVKPERDKPVTAEPHCPNPEIAQTPTPSKRRHVEK